MPEEYTLEKWKHVRPTMRLAEFCQWSGYNKSVVRDMVKSGEIKTTPKSRGGYVRYLKSEVSRLAGLPL